MPVFKTNTPIVQKEAVVKVDLDPAAPFPVGVNRFRLIVVDDAGNESAPAFLEVIVRDQQKPTAVLDMVNADGRRVDPVVEPGAGFTLSGGRSSDIAPGKIAEFRFTLVDRT